MKVLLISALLFFLMINAQSQVRVIDSLDNLIKKATSDTQRINLKLKKLTALANVNLDSSIALGKNIISESQRINYKKGEVKARLKIAGNYCFTGDYAAAKTNLDTSKVIISGLNDSLLLEDLYGRYGTMYSMQNNFDSSHTFYDRSIEIGRAKKDNAVLSTTYQNNAIAFLQESNYPQALTNFQSALSIAEQMNDEESEAYIYLNMAITYKSLDDPKRGEQSYLKSADLAKKLGLKNVLAYCYSNMATMYEDMKDFKKQYEFGMKAAALGDEIGDKGIEASSLSRAALGLANQGNFKDAEETASRAMLIADSSHQPLNVYQTNQDMGSILKMQKKYRDAISYYEKGFSSLDKSNIYDEEVGKSYANLSECYEQTGDFQKALAAYKMAAKISDSISGKENVKKATELTMNYEFAKKQQIAKDEEQKQRDLAKAKQTALIIGLALTLLLAIVAFRGFTNKRKANVLLHQQKEKVESTLTELKSTQAQLIQSEKMASLGELTAGIAHEIQNPLNFVNNFSEVNKELIEELKIKNEKLKIEDAEVNELLNDIEQNLEKINHHGKRADAIVKGMLQHSRQTSGTKELTDINALCNEYLRLSYHGLRAKDNSFNVAIKTDFDKTIGNINIIPQDIGRVLLNLYNNAFYAVSEKAKQLPNGYEPTISVSTKRSVPSPSERVWGEAIMLTVTDNGNGIPQNIVDKIFQPFFTTKPTGQGTGLGLSLAYDIITKEHNGTIKVESREGEGTMFIIYLPI